MEREREMREPFPNGYLQREAMRFKKHINKLSSKLPPQKRHCLWLSLLLPSPSSPPLLFFPMAELQSQTDSGEEFYEQIEAPKFVDFTKPDLPCPDDRYWFCSRVGCDQKHKEEMDDEAIYKDFVLRVMAARSPSVRFRKVLTRKSPSATVKCPLSAPAKPSESRLSRLAVISSFSKKTTEAKVKGSTPKPEVKQTSVVVKALTTPRNKKCPQNPVSFQSVRNPKATSIAVPKNRVVAKALVFQSPKKPRQKKASVELSTHVTKICQGMKRLEITSQRKRVLGYSVKSSKDIDAKDASRRKFGARKVKSRVYDSLNLENCKRREAKSSRCPKRKSKMEELEKCNGSLTHDGDANDSSDMEIDEKPRDAALSDTSNGGMISNSEENNFSESQSLSVEGTKRSGGSGGGVKSDSSYQSHPEDRDSEQKIMPKFHTQKSEGSKSSGGSEHEEKTKSTLRRRRFLEARPPEEVSEESGNSNRIKNRIQKGNQTKESEEKENDSPSDDKENNSEEIENDDEENASASDENRESKSNKDLCGNKLLGRQGAGGTTKKVTKLLDKTSMENLNSAAAGTQRVKCKPKPTNPKPFRLRTDERGILKEAKLEERRLHSLAPMKETTAVSRFPIATSRRRNQITQRNENCSGQEGTEQDQEKITQNQPRQIKTACKNSKGKVETSTITTPQRRTFKYPEEPDLMTLPLESDKEVPQSSSGKSKSSSLLQKKLVRSQGIVSSGKAMVSLMKTGQLDVIKETPSTVSCPKEAREPLRSVISATKAVSASRCSSRGRKTPTTIPKEPNFHSIHTTKRAAQGNWVR